MQCGASVRFSSEGIFGDNKNIAQDDAQNQIYLIEDFSLNPIIPK